MKWRSPKREILDQVLHALWAFVTVELILLGTGASTIFFVAPHPSRIVYFIYGVISLTVLIVREVKQWPPNKDRPYDPLLDLCGYLLGGVLALVVLI